MLTPQDIAEKGFVKAVFGGYDMASVDDFLESVSSDYTALYKENAILKGKLKVLVEKVEEYRSTEDAMRMALLTAQRMGEEITVEATRTKEEMIRSADEEVKSKLSSISKQIALEEARLLAASKETSKFLDLSHAILRKHSELLKKLDAANQQIKPPPAGGGATPTGGGAPPVGVGVPPPAPPLAGGTAPSAYAEPPAPISAQEAPYMPPLVSPQTVPAVSEPPPDVQVTHMPAPPEPLLGSAQADFAPLSARAASEIEFDAVAAQIGNAVEQIAEETSRAQISAVQDTPTPPPGGAQPPASLFDEMEPTIKLPVDETAVDITPRPKFDFDDLKFGANFDSDD
ncbi:MAG: DivIVA domain-containing protein [Oscillospiraceae bacterium]|nr:DivIVA domain-containing protein [Oscillospiraceae bacterium]